MRKEILIVGFACLSLIAVAQAPKKKAAPVGKSTNRESSAPSVSEVVVTKPNGSKTTAATGNVAASGHATGKRQHGVVVTKQTDAASPK